MTDKNINNGQFKQTIVDLLKYTALETIELTFHVLGGAISFLIILAVAAGVGYIVHLADVQAIWLPDLVVLGLIALKYMLFAADVVLLVRNVLKHVLHAMKGD